MFIKLCGFTRPEDIEKVKNLPISSVGFIFYKKSKRYVTPEHAGELARILEGTGIKTTGVFVDDDPETVMEIVRSAGLDMAQVYDANTASILSPKIPVIQCVRIGGPEQLSLPEPVSGGMVLFDTYSAENYGGTGKSFNRGLVKSYTHRERMIVAGGLNEKNITEIIRDLRPGGVDISSGIETSEGIKSGEKIFKIMQLIKEAENDFNA